MNTPVQTYAGLASMLDTDFETIIPSSFPAEGFQFTEPNYKDIAPRLGATYRLGEKTVVRAGYGIYYNPNQMNSFTFLTNNPPIAAVTTYTNDPANPTLSFINPSGVAGPITRPDMISPTRDLPNARKSQWSFDLQREVGMGMAVDLQYLGSHTDHLDRSFFNNTPQPGAGNVDARRPSQRYRSRRIIANDLIADYDAVSVILRKKMSHGLQADVHYTWSRTRDEATHSNGGGAVMDNYDPMRDYGPANWDVPHRFVASYIYDLPFLKTSQQRDPAPRRRRLADRGRHHHPERHPRQRHDLARSRQHRHHGLQRPDLVGPVPSMNCDTNPTTREPINCFDSTAFALPAQFTFGNASRNILRGPKLMSTDLSLSKTVGLGGPTKLQLRAEIFNVFNNVNFGNPSGAWGTVNFGRITGTAIPMRQIQLGARLLF